MVKRALRPIILARRAQNATSLPRKGYFDTLPHRKSSESKSDPPTSPFLMFLVVFLVPELFRKVRETRGINFHQVSTIYVGVVSSYDQKTEQVNEY